jgi:hypothetical protein
MRHAVISRNNFSRDHNTMYTMYVRIVVKDGKMTCVEVQEHRDLILSRVSVTIDGVRICNWIY